MARHWWLTPVTLHKKALVEWLKVKALSSNPSAAREKKCTKHARMHVLVDWKT
jgi:hypothetical protein